ncbi:hypothetical protein [Moorena sp. SIO4G3]|nr:hypothetical protein [Moorena sp. SIO4G3]NEO80695.1 hypothetical protein [Moorena sp. SIO4G3]
MYLITVEKLYTSLLSVSDDSRFPIPDSRFPTPVFKQKTPTRCHAL